MPAVLSTPWLIWFLEHAARAAILPLLDAGESTVGTLVELRHLTATPVGETVKCLARVVQAEGRSISFQLEARDEHELIARGFHKLRVINVERFAQKVRENSGNGRCPGLRHASSRVAIASTIMKCQAQVLPAARVVRASRVFQVSSPPRWRASDRSAIEPIVSTSPPISAVNWCISRNGRSRNRIAR